MYLNFFFKFKHTKIQSFIHLKVLRHSNLLRNENSNAFEFESIRN